MNNNAKFLNSIDDRTELSILQNIATHYGITVNEAYDEVADSEAEDLAEYVTGKAKNGVYSMMRKAGL